MREKRESHHKFLWLSCIVAAFSMMCAGCDDDKVEAEHETPNCSTDASLCTTATVANSSSVTCDAGVCKATECKDGYHVNAGACEQNSGGEDCSTNASLCTTDTVANSSSVTCDAGVCKATECKDGYHVNAGACEQNSGSEDCSTNASLCTIDTVANSSSVTCDAGVCKATDCKNGYHVNAGACEQDSGGEDCSTNASLCTTDTVANSSSVTCDAGVCKATDCKNGYHVNAGVCEQDSGGEDCSTNASLCTRDTVANSSSVTCDAGVCKPTQCTWNYHIYGEICEEDSEVNCRKHGDECKTTTIPHSAEVRCEDICRVETCEVGYHLFGNSCEQTDNTNCGYHGNTCSTANAEGSTEVSCNTTSFECEVTACDNEHTLKNGSCVPNNCTNGDSMCANNGTYMVCNDGQWVNDECPAMESPEPGTEGDPTHTTITLGAGTCLGGQCVYSCSAVFDNPEDGKHEEWSGLYDGQNCCGTMEGFTPVMADSHTGATDFGSCEYKCADSSKVTIGANCYEAGNECNNPERYNGKWCCDKYQWTDSVLVVKDSSNECHYECADSSMVMIEGYGCFAPGNECGENLFYNGKICCDANSYYGTRNYGVAIDNSDECHYQCNDSTMEFYNTTYGCVPSERKVDCSEYTLTADWVAHCKEKCWCASEENCCAFMGENASGYCFQGSMCTPTEPKPGEESGSGE